MAGISKTAIVDILSYAGSACSIYALPCMLRNTGALQTPRVNKLSSLPLSTFALTGLVEMQGIFFSTISVLILGRVLENVRHVTVAPVYYMYADSDISCRVTPNVHTYLLARFTARGDPDTSFSVTPAVHRA